MVRAMSERTPRWRSAWGAGDPRSTIRRTGDVLTLLAAFFAPLYGLVVGGIGYADVIFGLVILVRLVQFAAEGLPIWELRRHSLLIGVFGVFAVGGVISGLATGGGTPWEFLRIVVATIGAAVVVATYGQNEASLLPLVRAFALGCGVLAVSGLLGEQTGGRATGYSIHPNGLAHSCLMGAAAGAYLALKASRRGARRFWTLSAFLCALAILLVTGSRGSLLGLWLGLFLLCVLGGNRRLNIVAVALSYAAVLALMTGLIVLPPTNPIARFASGGEGSNRIRQEQLEQVIDEIEESPFTGKGWADINQIHMVYLQGWYGGGLLCGLSLIAFGLALLVLPFGQSRLHLALACGAAGVALAWTVTTVLTTRDQWLYLALALRICQPPLAGLGTQRLRMLAGR